jgi:hypothetical protein
MHAANGRGEEGMMISARNDDTHMSHFHRDYIRIT